MLIKRISEILGTLAATLLGSALTGRGAIRADKEVIRESENI